MQLPHLLNAILWWFYSRPRPPAHLRLLGIIQTLAYSCFPDQLRSQLMRSSRHLSLAYHRSAFTVKFLTRFSNISFHNMSSMSSTLEQLSLKLHSDLLVNLEKTVSRTLKFRYSYISSCLPHYHASSLLAPKISFQLSKFPNA